MVNTTKTLGDEQLIMLPFDHAQATPGEIVGLLPGRHAVVVSGYAGILVPTAHNPDTPQRICIAPPSSDDEIHHFDVRIVVGPVWERLVQVSASVSRSRASSAW
jgi:hypothetical protein